MRSADYAHITGKKLASTIRPYGMPLERASREP
jgi:hypothetical protein